MALLIISLIALTVGLFAGPHVGGRSDYWSGDTDPIVRDLLNRQRVRRRRAARKRRAEIDRKEKEDRDGPSS